MTPSSPHDYSKPSPPIAEAATKQPSPKGKGGLLFAHLKRGLSSIYSSIKGRVKKIADPIQQPIAHKIHLLQRKSQEKALCKIVSREIALYLQNAPGADEEVKIENLLKCEPRELPNERAFYRLENQIIAAVGIEKVDLPFLKEEIKDQIKSRYAKLLPYNVNTTFKHYQYSQICEEIASAIEEASEDLSLFSIQIPQALVDNSLSSLIFADCRELSDGYLEQLISYKKGLMKRCQQEKGAHLLTLIDTIRTLDQAIFKLKNKEDLKNISQQLILEKTTKIDDQIESSLLRKYSPRFLKNPQALKTIWEKSLQEAFARCDLKVEEAALSDQQKQELNLHRAGYRSKVRSLQAFLQEYSSELDQNWPIEYQEPLPLLNVPQAQIKSPFSAREEAGLKLLSKALMIGEEENDSLSTAEKHALEQFLLSLINNRAINVKLKKEDRIDIAEQFAYKFSYKTKQCDRAKVLGQKLEGVIKHLKEENFSALKKEEKISLADYDALCELASLAHILSDSDLKHSLPENSEMRLLIDSLEGIGKNLKELDHYFQQKVQANYRSGDIIAAAVNHPIPWKERIAYHFIDNQAHTSFLYNQKVGGETKLAQTHIFYRHDTDPYGLELALSSQVHRLNVAALIEPKALSLLKECYGGEEALFAAVQKMFEEANDKLQQDSKKFSHLQFSRRRAVKAAKADFGLAGGHKRKAPRTDAFQNIHDKWSGKKEIEGKEMFCSEFVAKSLIAALIESENQLKQVVGAHLEQKKELSEENLADWQWVNDPKAHLLKLPFNSQERLKRIHPGRILQLLNKTPGALAKVDSFPFMKQIFSDFKD